MNALATELRPLIERQLLRYPLPDEDRRDTVQTTLLQVFRKIGSFRGESTFTSWLFRVTANEALMLMRSRRRHAARVSDGLELDELTAEELSSFAAESAAACQRTDDVMMVQERLAWLRDALVELPRAERELVMAHYHFNLELRQIADRFALSEKAIRSRLHRARQRLRALLVTAPPFSDA